MNNSNNLILKDIEKQIKDNKIILYMKGSPENPKCGFSAKSAALINSYNIKFTTVDVLENPEIRSMLPQYSDWPTFPQLYVNGELIGGCDIISELHESGELKDIIHKVL